MSDPLHPSPRLLRLLAGIAAESRQVEVRGWVDAMSRRFAVVSVVATKRKGKLCGYEVWRHLATRRKDPARRKARLWFGLRPQHLGGETVDAFGQAQRAAKWLASLSDRELIAWYHRQKVQREQARRLKQQQRREAKEYRKRQRAMEREQRRQARLLERAERKRERKKVRGVRPQWKDGRVIGYAVCRTISGEDYRLWFGVAHWRSEIGHDGAARDVAIKAAARLFSMSAAEVRRAWSQRKKVNPRNRAIPEHMEGVFIDFMGLQQMSHAYARAS